MSNEHNPQVLRIDASARREGSVSRRLADQLIAQFIEQNPTLEIRERDLANGLPLLTAEWIDANFTDVAQRSASQRAQLELSDRLIRELEQADAIVLAAPIYNFSIPAALKAWIDLVTRARRTFRYAETGPEGLLRDKPVFLLMASGGVEIGGEADFASAYLRHVLSFIGLDDVRLVAAERLNMFGEQGEQKALAQLSQLSLGRFGLDEARVV